MMDVSTRIDPETGDVWVVASCRVENGETSVYQVRVPYLDMMETEAVYKRKIQDAITLATTRLRRMLDAHNSGN